MTRIFRQLAEVDCFRYGSRTCQGCVSLERREQDSSNSNLLEKFTSSLKSINGCSKRENLWGEQSRSWSPSWLRRLSIAGAAATNSGTEHQDREDAVDGTSLPPFQGLIASKMDCSQLHVSLQRGIVDRTRDGSTIANSDFGIGGN